MGLIAWTDLESTGLDTTGERDRILEVGVLLTDTNLEVVDSFEAIIDPSIESTFDWEARLLEGDGQEYVAQMHRENGLWTDVPKHGRPHSEVEAELVRWFRGHGVTAGGQVPMGGSGISNFDRPFLESQMPSVYELFVYWDYDLSKVRRFLEHMAGVESFDLEPPRTLAIEELVPHRALDDCWFALEQARWFRYVLDEKASVDLVFAVAKGSSEGATV